MEKANFIFKQGEQAHHIVQSTDSRAAAARELLDYYHIDINSASNGVKLTEQAHRAQGLQKTQAIRLVTRRLEAAAEGAKNWDAARLAVLRQLSNFRVAIAHGKFFVP